MDILLMTWPYWITLRQHDPKHEFCFLIRCYHPLCHAGAQRNIVSSIFLWSKGWILCISSSCCVDVCSACSESSRIRGLDLLCLQPQRAQETSSTIYVSTGSDHYQDDRALLISNANRILSSSPALCWLHAGWAQDIGELSRCLGPDRDPEVGFYSHVYRVFYDRNRFLMSVDQCCGTHICTELHLFPVLQFQITINM